MNNKTKTNGRTKEKARGEMNNNLFINKNSKVSNTDDKQGKVLLSQTSLLLYGGNQNEDKI